MNRYIKYAVSGFVLASALTACSPAVSETDVKVQAEANAMKSSRAQYFPDAPLTSFTDFILIETQMGEQSPRIVSLDAVIEDLAQYDVVFIGEAHGHAASHYVQSKIFSGLHAKHNNIALSMEQFERSQQHVVDDYLAGNIGEETLIHDGKAWDHYRSSYRPLVEYAKNNDLPVIAAEAPANMVSCVGEEGPAFLERLKGEHRTWIADKLNVQDGPYKDRFYAFMKSASGHSAGTELSDAEQDAKRARQFAAQVSRDDTMAESIFKHMEANPGRKVVHVNGSFHSAALLGTPERLLMRSPDLKVANIHPILVDKPEEPSFEKELVGEGQYLLLLYPTPRRFVKMDNINAFLKRTKDKIDEKRCAY